jgi:hypothetical protein
MLTVKDDNAVAKTNISNRFLLLFGSVRSLIDILVFGSVLSLIGICPILDSFGIHDFSASVNPMIVYVRQDDTINAKNYDPPTKINVIPGLLYNENICFRSESTSPGISVKFYPQQINHWNFQERVRKVRSRKRASVITISVGKDVNPGEYLISVACFGSDGKEHICKLFVSLY